MGQKSNHPIPSSSPSASSSSSTVSRNTTPYKNIDRALLLEKYAIGAHANHDAYPLWLLCLFLLVTAWCAIDIVNNLQDGIISIHQMVPIFVFQLFMVDLYSGMTHIVLDNPFFAEKQNWFGIIEPLAKGFQEHHLDPTLIYKMSVVEHLRPMCTPLLLSFGVGLLIHNHPIQSWFHFVTSVALCVMQMAHRWSHMPKEMRPWGVTTFQSIGLLLKPAVHLKHHRSPYQTQFCISSGIFNNPLDWITANVISPFRTEWVWILLTGLTIPHFLIRGGFFG